MGEEPVGENRTEVERGLIRRSLEDESFRRRLLADPKAVLQAESGGRLPEEVRVVALEETPDTVYLVLPSRSAVEQGELSDQDLEAVAGGWPPASMADTCGDTCSC